MKALVQVSGLAVDYTMAGGPVRALDGVDLQVGHDETVGLVGESGSGKSTLGMALGRVLAPNALFTAGDIVVDGVPVLRADAPTLRRLRRERLGFVFQNPMSALDPTMRIGRQLELAAAGADNPVSIDNWLRRVGLSDTARVARSFAHELSGGMAQRVVIAMAVLRRPALLVADEPTASLDASIQGLILDLLEALRSENGSSLVLMSHDLRMVARRCRRVLVMYGGRVVEAGASHDLFERPRHPYTRALIRAAAGNEGPDGRLMPIIGSPPLLRSPASGCSFAPRCPLARPQCTSQRPEPRLVAGRTVICHFAEALDDPGIDTPPQAAGAGLLT